MTIRQPVALMARLLVGGVLVTAGALKAMDPTQTVLAVGAYALLPAKGSLAVGFLLPGVEITVGAALVTGFLLRGAALLAALLSAVFLFVVASAHLRHLDIACGCFGAISPALESGWLTAPLDVLMLAGSAVAWRGARAGGPQGP
jgi:uncharacterized membrane protein YphA (DoxX/SURF4 family)